MLDLSIGPGRLHDEVSLSSVGNSSILLAIARELRDIIYTDLITSGSVAILRVSKQVHHEAKELLYRKGRCELRLFFADPPGYLKVLCPFVIPPDNTIQNFNLIMSLPTIPASVTGPTSGYEPLSPVFVRSMRGSGNCHIVLVSNGAALFDMPTAVFKFMKHLCTFRLVTLRIYCIQTYHPMDRRNENVLKPRHMQQLGLVARSVSAALGDPEWKPNTPPNFHLLEPMSAHAKEKPPMSPFPNAPYLEFRPRNK